MSVVWRLFGLVLMLLWLQHMSEDTVFAFADKSAGSLDALGGCGLTLLITGPNPLVLVACAGVGGWFFADVLARVPTLHFTADEYAVQAGLPIAAVIVSAVHVAGVLWRRAPLDLAKLRGEVDELHARTFRIFLVTTLAFAGLHKLNADFFTPGSCAALGQRLDSWWALPFDLPVAGPLAVVTLELLAAVMLLVYPRIGILLVVYVMAGLGHIGPSAFASTCTIMSLAFLDRGDIVLVRRLFDQHWGSIAAAVLIVTSTSFSSYQNRVPWLRYGLLELLLVTVACITIATGIARLRQRSTRRRRLVPAGLRWWQRPRTTLPGLTSWLALILVVNGMTPYLGIKYRFSEAMLSNLRVDAARWNSFVIPQWVQLRKHSPHTVVEWRPIGHWNPPAPKLGRHVLHDGLYSGDALVSALQDATARRARGTLILRYGEQLAEFELPQDTLSALAWAKQRPSSVLWQSELGPSDQPQTCVH